MVIFTSVALTQGSFMSDSKESGQDLAQQLAEVFVPGEKWTHYKGNLYEIVAVGVFENTGEVMVAYKSLKFGTIWIRTVTNFTETVKLPTGDVQRFRRGDFVNV